MKQFEHELLTMPFNFIFAELQTSIRSYEKDGFELTQVVDCPQNKDEYGASCPMHLFIFKRERNPFEFTMDNPNKEATTLMFTIKKPSAIKKWFSDLLK